MVLYEGVSVPSPPAADALPGDAEVLRCSAQGDPDALATLYDRHGGLVFRLALRIVGDRRSAGEVTQDVFQIVWRQAHTFRPTAGSVAAWLIGITRHCALDELRSRRSTARRRELGLDTAPVAAGGAQPAFEAQVVLRTEVRAALAALPVEQRRTIEFAYFGGLTGPEMAAALGLPLGTVKTRLRLALVRLRAVLRSGGEPD